MFKGSYFLINYLSRGDLSNYNSENPPKATHCKLTQCLDCGTYHVSGKNLEELVIFLVLLNPVLTVNTFPLQISCSRSYRIRLLNCTGVSFSGEGDNPV